MDSQKDLTILDNFNKRLPMFSAVVIVLGFLNSFLYYHYFGIPVYNYLETSEIIFSFSSIVPILLSSSFAYLMMNVWEYIFRKQREEQEKRVLQRLQTEKETVKQEKPEKDPWWSTLLLPLFLKTPGWFHPIAWFIIKLLIAIIVYASIAAGFTVIAMLAVLLFTKVTLLTFNNEAFFTLLFFMVVGIVRMFLPRQIVLVKSMAIYFAIILLFILLRTRAAYNAVIEGNPKYNVSLNLGAEPPIVSDTTTLLYVGSTRNYHFFHNNKKGENLVIPNSKVSATKIVELRTGV
jgi:hypothetical protein